MLQKFVISFTEFSATAMILRMIVALICGGLIGMERGHRGRPAGLRTHILVCVGSAISIMVGLYIVSVLGYANDPTRMGAQVISGIGFLGGGAIMIVGRSQVRGLTTAAGLWTTATIGLAIGAGCLPIAICGTMMVLITMIALGKLTFFKPFDNYTERYYIEISDITKLNELAVELKRDYHAVDVTVTAARSGVSGHMGIELYSSYMMQKKKTEIQELQQRDYIVVAVQTW